MLLSQCERFVEIDNRINESVAQLAKTIADEIAIHPEILRAGLDPRALAEALERGGLAAAGDLAGGDLGDLLKDLFNFIGDFLKGEKDFFIKILSKIFDL